MDIGSKADKGYIVAPGCDIPETTEARQVRFFMDAVRKGQIYRENLYICLFIEIFNLREFCLVDKIKPVTDKY